MCFLWEAFWKPESFNNLMFAVMNKTLEGRKEKYYTCLKEWQYFFSQQNHTILQTRVELSSKPNKSPDLHALAYLLTYLQSLSLSLLMQMSRNSTEDCKERNVNTACQQNISASCFFFNKICVLRLCACSSIHSLVVSPLHYSSK